MGENSRPTDVFYITDDGEQLPFDMECPPEVTLDTERLAEAAAWLARVWQSITVDVQMAADAITQIFQRAVAAEKLKNAVRWAETYNRPLANRYWHTKKKRTRKKYAKRILEWYQEEVL